MKKNISGMIPYDKLKEIYLTGNVEVLEAFEQEGIDRLVDLNDACPEAKTRLLKKFETMLKENE